MSLTLTLTLTLTLNLERHWLGELSNLTSSLFHTPTSIHI